DSRWPHRTERVGDKVGTRNTRTLYRCNPDCSSGRRYLVRGLGKPLKVPVAFADSAWASVSVSPVSRRGSSMTLCSRPSAPCDSGNKLSAEALIPYYIRIMNHQSGPVESITQRPARGYRDTTSKLRSPSLGTAP